MRANEQASGPVLMFRFLVVLTHSATCVVPGAIRGQISPVMSPYANGGIYQDEEWDERTDEHAEKTDGHMDVSKNRKIYLDRKIYKQTFQSR